VGGETFFEEKSFPPTPPFQKNWNWKFLEDLGVSHVGVDFCRTQKTQKNLLRLAVFLCVTKKFQEELPLYPPRFGFS